jgi:hypothetical protein
MSLRISSAAFGGALGLAACAPEAGPPPGAAVECALGKGARWSAACTLEREAEPGRFVLHHPGGGFRRFAYDPATGAISPADGAERIGDQTGKAGMLAFALGENRYRIPLRLLAHQP